MTETAKRYGGSLYELAKEEQLTDELLSELETAVICFGENADYMRLLTAENLPKKERCGLIDEDGREILPIVYSELSSPAPGYIQASDEEGVHLLKLDGTEIWSYRD